MKLENRKDRLLTTNEYFFRQLKYALISMALVVFSLLIGVLGYRHFANLSWVDSLLNACMILTGMGPVNEMNSESAKLFASFYSLYSGIAFLGICAVFIAPMAHRILHIFHAEEEDSD